SSQLVVWSINCRFFDVGLLFYDCRVSLSLELSSFSSEIARYSFSNSKFHFRPASTVHSRLETTNHVDQTRDLRQNERVPPSNSRWQSPGNITSRNKLYCTNLIV